jgi:hypothetical protein
MILVESFESRRYSIQIRVISELTATSSSVSGARMLTRHHHATFRTLELEFNLSDLITP